DVARNDDECPPQLWERGRPRVQSEDDPLCAHTADVAAHLRWPSALEPSHRRMLEHANAALDRDTPKTARQSRRMNGRGARLEHACQMHRRCGPPSDLLGPEPGERLLAQAFGSR